MGNKVYCNPKQKICILRLTEKLWIINFIHDNNSLNKKSELINKCRYFNKFLWKFILVIYCLTKESVQSPKLGKYAVIIQLFHPVRKPIHLFWRTIQASVLSLAKRFVILWSAVSKLYKLSVLLLLLIFNLSVHLSIY